MTKLLLALLLPSIAQAIPTKLQTQDFGDITFPSNVEVKGALVVRSSITALGDVSVGSGTATASTISASGFLTLAKRTSAPTASAGRLYFDSAGQGALRLSLDGTTFVPIATGTVSGGGSSSTFTFVTVNPAQFTGDGTAGNPLNLNSSSVTLFGNSIPAASIASGTLGAAVVASSVANSGLQLGNCGSATESCVLNFGLDGRARVVSSATITTGGGGVVITTSTIGWGNPNSQITNGTTIFSFVPTTGFTVRKMCQTIHTADNSSTGTHFICNLSTGGPFIEVRTAPAQSLGTVTCSTASVSVPAEATMNCYIQSDAGSKPITNGVMEVIRP